MSLPSCIPENAAKELIVEIQEEPAEAESMEEIKLNQGNNNKDVASEVTNPESLQTLPDTMLLIVDQNNSSLMITPREKTPSTRNEPVGLSLGEKMEQYQSTYLIASSTLISTVTDKEDSNKYWPSTESANALISAIQPSLILKTDFDESTNHY